MIVLSASSGVRDGVVLKEDDIVGTDHTAQRPGVRDRSQKYRDNDPKFCAKKREVYLAASPDVSLVSR